MVSQASAHSCAVGSPSVAGAEEDDVVARARGGRPPRSTTSWSMQTRPRTGRRGSAGPHLDPVAGGPRDALAVPDGDDARRVVSRSATQVWP